ncbi:hypothetical protein AB4Z38_25500 [Arthrobacter sp. 2RAF6]|uniref:hypothetical protein n=1 Tax=Arthrobacter sp. 2RAF6 TaxID=3233002 RepID=UPI003F8F6121
MTYAHTIQRVTISGTCFSGAEIWQTGFWLGDESADTSTATQAQVDAIAARWATFFSSGSTQINNSYITTQVKVANILTTGHTDPLNVVYHTYGTPPVGSAGGNRQAPQTTLVATLTSALSRGLAAKGRMYLPGPSMAVQSNGRVQSFDISGIATAFQTFINGVNSDGTPDQQVILVAKATTLPAVKPAVNALVTGINFGDVYDTQRRRRDQLKETRTGHTIP